MALSRPNRRALAFVPLAVLAAVWANATVAPTVPVAAVPVQVVQAARAAQAEMAAPAAVSPGSPASVSDPQSIAPTSALVRATTVSQVGSPSDIPSHALAAYQRAESVLGTADSACRLPWELLAAVGRVESDHGRYGGSVLNDEGIAQPSIIQE